MTKIEILSVLEKIIQDCFNVWDVVLTNSSRLSDFEPDELDLILFLTEIDFEFNLDLEEEFPDLACTPIGDIMEYIYQNQKTNQPPIHE
jgi:hypothetical protein